MSEKISNSQIESERQDRMKNINYTFIKNSLYLNLIQHKSFYNKKKTEIFEFMLNLQGSSKILSQNDFKRLRELAISEGGFLDNEIRSFLYRKIFNVKESKILGGESQIETLKIYESLDQKKGNKNSFLFKSERHSIIEGNNSSIITQEINNELTRSILFKLKITELGHLDREDQQFLLKELRRFLSRILSMKNLDYNYYPGYQEICFYIMMLYLGKQNLGISVMQRISEIHLRKYLSDFDLGSLLENNKNILNYLISELDPEVYKLLEPNDEESSVTLNETYSWLLSLFTRGFTDHGISYRILDYLLISPSHTSFYLSCTVINHFIS
jgi:hypothetical protein